MILKDKYVAYENALLILNLDSIQVSRTTVTLKFAKSGIKNQKLYDLFPQKEKIHNMETRNNEKFELTFANTNRLKNSNIPTMQAYLNDDERLTKK